MCFLLSVGSIENLQLQEVKAAVTLKSSSIMNYALGKVGQSYPNGYCLKFVEECYQNLGAVRPYSCCASKSGNSFLRFQSSSDIPVGATVYFGKCGGGPCRSCGSAYYGHVGIYVGDGYFVHATGGKVQKSTISSWADKYRGYGYCGNFNLNQDFSGNKTMSRPTYSNFWLSKKNTSMTEYKLGDTIEVNVDASNYDKLTIGIDKDGVGRVVTKDISSHYTFPSTDLGVGSYSIYVTVSNSNGYVDTNRLWFTISNATRPSYSNFWLSKKNTSLTEYMLGDMIEVNIAASNYSKLTIGIDKDGAGRVVTKDISSHYTFPSTDLGEGSYSIYITVSNANGYVDTNKLWFTISKPQYTGFSISKSKYVLGEEVEVKIKPTHYSKLVIGIDKDGVGRVVTRDISSGYVFSSNDLGVGKYSMYISVYNPHGYYIDTNRLKFEIYNKETEHKFGTWTTIKKATCTADGSEKRTCSICGKAESRALKATGHKYTDKVVAPTTTQKGYTLHTCTNCGSSYKDNYKDILKKQEDDRITITYDSCGGDLGVKNRGGIKGITTSVWSEIPKKNYLITLDPNGGVVSDKTKYVSAPFKAWYTSQDAKGTRYNTGQTVSFTKSMILYAAYGNAEIGNLPTPSRSGYTFNGWYLSSGTKVSSDTLISGDCQVAAMWTEDVKETMHTHTAGQWEIVREATATMPGESVLKCKECGEIMDTKVIPILTNTESNDNGFTDKDIVIDDSPEKDVEAEPEDDMDEDEEEETFFVGDEITTDTAIFTVTKTGENPSVEYTELFDEDVTDVSIPESITIYGVTYKVTAIAAKAFYKNTSIKKVTITSHVTKIGSKAFYGCTSLKNIVILSTKLKSSQIGTNAFTKVTKNVKVYVPQKNYKTYKKLLKKAGVGSKAKFIKLK